ncbi:unnamed protein product [Schistosoma bovis]|nr:unnamed protein product [Schistosoma bovis]
MMITIMVCKSIHHVILYFAIGLITFLTINSEEYNQGLLYNSRLNAYNKRWFPVKEFHYDEPLEIKKRPLMFHKRWFPVKEFHYDGPLEVKKRSKFQDKRWSPKLKSENDITYLKHLGYLHEH